MDFWNEDNSWSFTVIRAKGFQGLRPEKAWRPIVHITVDDHLSHEINLGCDGQNPNLKQPFLFKEKMADSRVNVNLFHRSQSKKKGKKRNLVATASLSLEDLLKIQGSDRTFEIKLNAGTSKLRTPMRRQSSPPCLIARLSPPNLPSTSTLSRPSSPYTPDSNTLLDHDSGEDDSECSSEADSHLSERSSEHGSPWDEEHWPEPQHSGARVKGYLSESDDDKSVICEDEPLLPKSRDSTLQQGLRHRHPHHHHHHFDDSEDITLNGAEEEDNCDQVVDEVTITNQKSGFSMSISRIAASLLPQAHVHHHEHHNHHHDNHHHEHLGVQRPGPSSSSSSPSPQRSSTLASFSSISTLSSLASIETVHSVVDSFSPYRALREASVDSDFERILQRLQREWTFVGGSLIALAGLDAAVFGLSSPGGGGGTLFTITPFAAHMVALGAIASGLGILTVAYLLLYTTSSMDASAFQRRALDVYASYLFFCISARLPAACMFVAACALMAFLGSVAWSAWPAAVLVMCFLAGVVVSLQFIVYGVHCAFAGIARVVRALKRGLVWVFNVQQAGGGAGGSGWAPERGGDDPGRCGGGDAVGELSCCDSGRGTASGESG